MFIAVDSDAVFVHAFGRAFRLDVADPTERGLAGADEADVYGAPMPGIVIRTTVGAGQEVSAGDVVMVIESMKMQAEIVAWRDGVVERLPLAVGDSFDRGAILVEFQPAAAETDDAP